MRPRTHPGGDLAAQTGASPRSSAVSRSPLKATHSIRRNQYGPHVDEETSAPEPNNPRSQCPRPAQCPARPVRAKGKVTRNRCWSRRPDPASPTGRRSTPRHRGVNRCAARLEPPLPWGPASMNGRVTEQMMRSAVDARKLPGARRARWSTDGVAAGPIEG